MLVFRKYFIQNTKFGYFSNNIKAFALGIAGVSFLFQTVHWKTRLVTNIVYKIWKVSKFESCVVLHVRVQLQCWDSWVCQSSILKNYLLRGLEKMNSELEGGQIPFLGEKTKSRD